MKGDGGQFESSSWHNLEPPGNRVPVRVVELDGSDNMSVGDIIHLHICIRMLCMSGPLMSKEGVRSSGTEVKNYCEPSCEYWELNVGNLQE